MNLRSVLGSMWAPVLVHGQNQNEAKERALAAQAQGLDPNKFGTAYPGSTVISTENQSGKGWLLGPVLGVAIAAVGGAGALALKGSVPPSLSGNPSSALAPSTAPILTPSSLPVERDYVHYDKQNPQTIYGRSRFREWPDGKLERRLPDGTWKETTFQELDTITPGAK